MYNILLEIMPTQIKHFTHIKLMRVYDAAYDDRK